MGAAQMDLHPDLRGCKSYLISGLTYEGSAQPSEARRRVSEVGLYRRAFFHDAEADMCM
jgi:hypothetical protein